MKVFHRLRTWSRRTIWGDRLFLQFDGPSTILLQSRGARVNEILSSREVDELASAPRGLTILSTESVEQQATGAGESAAKNAPGSRTIGEIEQEIEGVSQSIAVLTKEGKVTFEKPTQTS